MVFGRQLVVVVGLLQSFQCSDMAGGSVLADLETILFTCMKELSSNQFVLQYRKAKTGHILLVHPPQLRKNWEDLSILSTLLYQSSCSHFGVYLGCTWTSQSHQVI